jgi:hypothetical protein
MSMANVQSPNAVVLMDPSQNPLTVIGGALSVAGTFAQGTGTSTVQLVPATYTQISTNGTTTVKGTPGVFFGVSPVALGTVASFAVFDGTKTLMATQLLSALNALISPAPDVGVAFTTSLIVVTSGTIAGAINVLWD